MKRLLFLFCIISLSTGCAAIKNSSEPVTDGIPVTYRMPKDVEPVGYKGIRFNQFTADHQLGEKLRGTEITADDNDTLIVRSGNGHYSTQNETKFLGSYAEYKISVTEKDLGAFTEILFTPTLKSIQDNSDFAVPAMTTKDVVNSLVWSTVKYKMEFTSEFNPESIINNFNRKFGNSPSRKDKNNVYTAKYAVNVDGANADCDTKIALYRNTGSLVTMTIVLPLKSENGGQLVNVPPQIEKLKATIVAAAKD